MMAAKTNEMKSQRNLSERTERRTQSKGTKVTDRKKV